MIGNAHYHVHVVLDEEKCDVLLGTNRIEQLVEAVGLAGIETRCRLVEAKQERSRAHGSRNLEASLVSVRKLAGNRVGARGQTHPAEPLARKLESLLLGGTIAAKAQKSADGDARRAVERLMLRHHQVLEHRQTFEQSYVLERARHPCFGVDIVVVEPLEIEARPVRMGEGEHPLGWLVETSHAVEHRSLAGPVRSDQGSDVAAAYLERHIVDRGQAAEAHGDVFDLEERVLLPSRHVRRTFASKAIIVTASRAEQPVRQRLSFDPNTKRTF